MKRQNKIILISIAAAVVIGASILIYFMSNFGGQKILGNKQNNAQKSTTINQQTKQEGTNNNNSSEDSTAKNEATKVQEGQTGENVNHIKVDKVKAVYYSGAFSGSDKRVDHIIDVIKSTELNALVVDIKEAGRVNYESQVPAVKDNKLYTKFYDPKKLIKKLHDNGIYVIGRIVCFRDDGLASKRADLAIKTPGGSLWREHKNDANTKWTNPYNKEVWEYNIEIAKEAVDLGFDEIQFDYVRFPTASSKQVTYGNNVPEKSDAISGFLKMAADELHKKGAIVSADIFGIVCVSPPDGKSIGQVIEKVGMDIDYISPMVYPSHYANAGRGVMGNGAGQKINGINFTAPDLQPYDVVYNTLLEAKKKISAVPGYKAKMRPYLQDFTATYIRNKSYYQEYGAEQVRQQIKAVYDAGYEEWILWDGKNTYSEDALLKE